MSKLNKAGIATLLAVAAAMAVAPNYLFATEAAAKPLIDLKLAEQNKEIANPANGAEFATRLTDAGMAEAKANGHVAGQAPAGAAETPAFVIATVARPNNRGNRTGSGGTSKYPFDQLAPDQAFFIPTTGDAKAASKSFGSLVSSTNKKFATNDANYKRFTTRTMAGDAFGKPGVQGVAIFRMSTAEEAAAKAKAFPPAGTPPAA